MATEEIDFHLEISPYPHAGHPDGYLARVLSAPSGGLPSAMFDIDVGDIVNRRDDLENAILAASVPARRAIPVSERSLHEVGTCLFRAVFDGPVNNGYRASLGAAQHQRKRLRLVLSLTAPELAAIPWELLFDPHEETYLCRQRPLVRHIPAPDFDPLPLDVAPPLRILCIVASPRNLGGLDTEAEIDQLREALREQIEQRRIELVCISQASWSSVHRHLLSGTWHVLHFIGHGDYDPLKTEGCIALVGEDGRADMVEASRLTELLDEAEPTPRLVVLNSCSSGRAATDDLFAGTAAALARGGISAVAAMQFTVSDSVAIEFARGFYTAVAKGRDIDRAVLSGRKAILGLPNTLEWATPVLYIRGGSTQLFRLTDQTPPAPSSPSPSIVSDPPSNPVPEQRSDPSPAQPSNPIPVQRSEPNPATVQPSNPAPVQRSDPFPAQRSDPFPAQSSDPFPAQRFSRIPRQPTYPVPETAPEQHSDHRSRPVSGPVSRPQSIPQSIPQPSRPPVEPPSPEPRHEPVAAPTTALSDEALADNKPVAPKLLLCLVAAGLAIVAAGLMLVNPFVPFAKGSPGHTIYNRDELRFLMIPSMSLAFIAGLAGILTISTGRARQFGLGLILIGAAIGPWQVFTQWTSDEAWSSPWGNWDVAVWVWVIGASSWILAAGVAGVALLSTHLPSLQAPHSSSGRRTQLVLLVGGLSCIALLWHHFSMPDAWQDERRISQLLGGLWIAGAALLVPLVASTVREHALRIGLILGWAGISTAFLFYRFRILNERHDDSAVPLIFAIIFGLLVVACVVLFTRTWRNGSSQAPSARKTLA